MRFRTCLLLVVVLGAARPIRADLASGPEVVKKLPALKVYAVAGLHQGKEVDYAADRKGKPTVYVFIQADQWNRPSARFLRALEAGVRKDRADAYVVAVWLTDKPEATKAYLPRAQQALQFTATALTFFKGAKTGPDGWGINPDACITAVVSHNRKVAGTFAYGSINETDAPKVAAALKKTAKGK